MPEVVLALQRSRAAFPSPSPASLPTSSGFEKAVLAETANLPTQISQFGLAIATQKKARPEPLIPQALKPL